MINKNNGYLDIAPEITLMPNDSLGKIENLKLGEVQELRDLKNGYKWLTIKNIELNSEYFIVALCFLNDRLKFLNLIVDDKKFDLNRTWDLWSEKEEIRKLEEFQKWIKKKLGQEGQFSWGQVTASYDPKGGSSSIIITYN